MTRKIPQLNTAAFIRSVIADMRKTVAAPDMVLDMGHFAVKDGHICFTCAGGSAVIWGMGAARVSDYWDEAQQLVADWCDDVRTAMWAYCRNRGFPVPEAIRTAWSDNMRMYYAYNPEPFWMAWENFAEAWDIWESENGLAPYTGKLVI